MNGRTTVSNCSISHCGNEAICHASWGGKAPSSEANLCNSCRSELFIQLNPLLKTGDCWVTFSEVKDG